MIQYIPGNIFSLILSLIIFQLVGLIYALLFFRRIIIKNIKKRNFLIAYLYILAVSFTINAFIGYFLDYFLKLTWYYHFSFIIIGFIILIIKERKNLVPLFQKIKNLEIKKPKILFNYR